MVLLDTHRSNGTVRVFGDNAGPQGPVAPTIEQVNTIRSDYSLYYSSFHGNCREEEDFYFGNFTIPTPIDMAIDPVKPATANAIVNVATDHVDTDNPMFFVPDPSPRSKDRAERIKKFLQGAWMHMPSRVLKTGVRQEFLYGLSFLKVMFASDQWPDAPIAPPEGSDETQHREDLIAFMRKRSISFPFLVKNVNPRHMIWDDSRSGIKWAIETYDTPARNVRAMYPQWESSKGPSEMASWTEYWDDTFVGYMADNDWVWGPFEHGYGFMPYVPILPAIAIDYDVGPPEKRYRGILRPVHNLIETEARIMTQLEAILRRYSWGTIDFYGNKLQAAQTADEYEIFGGKNIIPPGVEPRPSPQMTPPQELITQLSLIQTMIEEATFPNVVRGARPRGISSGFGVSVLAGMGRLRFTDYANGMANAIEEVNKRFLMLIENKLKGRVTVRARSQVHSFDQAIGPGDIKGFYENKVKLKAEAPEEREREAILAERLYKSRIISQYEAMRRAGVTSPLEEMNQIAAEEILQGMRETQIQAAIEGVQLSKQLAASAGVPPPTMGGVPGMGGMPGMGGAGAPVNTGNQFSPLIGQLQRPAEANLQQARMAAQQGRPSPFNPRTFPQGLGGIDNLGGRLGSPGGGAVETPPGEVVR